MLITSFFTTDKKWKQLKCSPSDTWINKARYTHTMEYYSSIKMKY